jgi:hypothetical protein
LYQSGDITTIPRTKRRKHLQGNVLATIIRLSEEDLARINETALKAAAAGSCYPEATMRGIYYPFIEYIWLNKTRKPWLPVFFVSEMYDFILNHLHLKVKKIS